MKCPICKLYLSIEPINCGIIRCGGYWNEKKFVQFPQHAQKKEIDTLKGKYKYIGCGNPLKLQNNKIEKALWSS